MWITLQPDFSAIFLPLATGAAAAVYALASLAGLFVVLMAKHPSPPLRVAAWSGGLAVLCVVITAAMALVDLPWPDDDLVHALLWIWVMLFLGGVGLIAWQGWRRT